MPTPELSDATRRQIINGVKAAANGRSPTARAAERDAVLLPSRERVRRR
jgi:hypothetical protein